MTQEKLLINKYSKMLEEVTNENRLLTEMLAKEKQISAMHYENSRRHKLALEEQLKKNSQAKELL